MKLWLKIHCTLFNGILNGGIFYLQTIGAFSIVALLPTMFELTSIDRLYLWIKHGSRLESQPDVFAGLVCGGIRCVGTTYIPHPLADLPELSLC